MTRFYAIAILLLLTLWSCRKKSKNFVEEDPLPPPVVTENPIFKCQTLPPTPVPFGWHDTTTNVDQNINTFMFNPANPDEVLIVVNGDIFGFNKMFCFNLRTQKSTLLASLDDYTPSINKNGWVLYSTLDNNIFNVKCNGDSLKQLTFGNTTKDPKWDYSGDSLYYFQMAYNNVPPQLVRATAGGKSTSQLPAKLPTYAPFKKSNKIIYQVPNDNSVTLVLRDMLTFNEKILITGPYNPQSSLVYFDNLCLDNSDENFYWSNSAGVFRCSISTLKVDTILKNCATLEYFNPVFQPSRPNELLVGCHFIKAISNFDLLHEYKAVDRDMVTREMNIVKIFP